VCPEGIDAPGTIRQMASPASDKSHAAEAALRTPVTKEPCLYDEVFPRLSVCFSVFCSLVGWWRCENENYAYARLENTGRKCQREKCRNGKQNVWVDFDENLHHVLLTKCVCMLTDVIVCVYRDLFPSSRCLFMYRDVLTVAKSCYRMSLVIPSLRLGYLLGYISSHVTKIIVDSIGFDGTDFRQRLDNDLTGGVLLSAVTTSSYLELRRRGFDVSALRYEDLVARPLDMCRVVLEFCHLPVTLAELAVKAFDVDAQRNSIIAKSVIGHFKEPELTPQRRTKLNEMLKKFGRPLIGEPDVIEGTLSCS